MKTQSNQREIEIGHESYQVLCALAQQDGRSPDEEIAWLIEQEVARRPLDGAITESIRVMRNAIVESFESKGTVAKAP